MTHGLFPNLDSIHRIADVQSRSICAENPRGEVAAGGQAVPTPDAGAARELGRGWKVKPCVQIQAGETFEVADIEGPGAIQQMWYTFARVSSRFLILRIYWDDQEQPSVECPLGPFFACGWNKFAQVSSLPVCVNPGMAFNCYWPMPFRKRCRITVENIDEQEAVLFYQVNYALGPVEEDAAYFHAQFRRTNPVPDRRVHTILDHVSGRGQYVGTYMMWGVNNTGWWGEGEIKFYLDDDLPKGGSIEKDVAEHGGDAFPTICGTGTEDYFCGSYNFDPGVPDKTRPNEYTAFTTPHAGLPQIIRPDGNYQSQTRFGLYRWHLVDPIRFTDRLAVTIQALGWRSGGRYLPLRDDLASVAYWYQTLPTVKFPELPDKDGLEVV